MKKLITFLLIIVTITSYGQTKLDKEIFKVVNEYRTQNGLTSWKWDQKTFKVAEKHNYYQTQVSDIYHGEPTNIRNHVEINTLGARLDDGGLTEWVKCGENLAVVNSNNLTITAIAKKTLSMWIKSPSHKRLLLSSNHEYTYCGVSSITTQEWIGSKYTHDWTYITLNVYRK